ncbi:3'(2'),5'-bisphosphate nucleotidase CysQ family protein [Rhizobium ruizarguesonis]|jgi:3'(2'), 5'-bisphosphate nucleotidase|uniref:3'(2'),5'-bisphosphate nucleotidase CysQ family protein n=1 Tax=Rhizobium ruizarguesonis TaxID=2081791 RepID=UPI0010301607|nr:3'(2'),5'-bisphosphate nucleotidase CysQ [Rhizobium ruizarguesonis]NEI09874.1 3'(2'),5'-bisphosphate nucleotidase CysQ [Rhizobium ruizarguesonis]NEI31757.1 3'(2'),5'-bisphosphate nucleotidase CysQ [Rhizobium ruizarguesonis]TAY96435.1 3'(2'),5'-bisphosphate nucleotidase CysQ [Rhizobium ruizarguesonis]TAZ80818.1 3'(2'),5'-bisphosphate nucleotidase CysQ [Rhizobium ruizarguesonis]TBA07204.1 3'(2'),5'-bisphosphate nucleotidase CysQ [Rhizobium ruizarguesonis]
MNLSSRRQLVEALIPVIRKAGDAVLALQGDDVAVRAKQDGSPVTSADLASNDILYAACLALFPAMPVISEEDSPVFEARKDSDSVLLIDPLDGTKEFIKGRDEFAVNIALVENGHASAGLIYAPARDRLFFSYGAGLAFEQTAGGQRRSLPRPSAPRRHPIALVSRSHLDPRTEALLAALQPCDIEEIGSSLKFALVAAAEADFYLRLAPTMIWDCAAGQAIIEAAGGVVLQTDGTSLTCDGKGKLKLDGFIAARTPQLAARLIATLRELETTSAVATQQ